MSGMTGGLSPAPKINGKLNAPQSLGGKVIPRGEDGISPVVETSEIEGGCRIEITDINGTKTVDLMHGEKGDKGDAFTYSDFTPDQLATLKGEPGYTPQKNVDYFDGSNGKDGYSATHSWNGTTLTITSAAGTSSADLKGDKGDSIKGDKGDPGYTPQKGVDYFDGKNGTSVAVQSVEESADDGGINVVTFSDGKMLAIKNGTKGGKGDPGYTPIKGKDYFDGKPGKDGTSISVASVAESTADGEANIVTFSDGTQMAVRNGKKGEKGDAGESGIVTPANGFFTLSVDAEGNLWAHTSAEGVAPTFEYDSATGDLYYVTE